MEDQECQTVAPITAAIRSITKASDVRNDNELLLQPYSNWEQFLMPGPLSVAILGEIIFLSAGEDFAIDRIEPIGGFKFVKYPKSFRASLVQVSNQGWEAFQEAHKNMDQIRLYTLTVPMDMKDAVKFILQKDPEVTKKFLPIPLGSIKSSAEKCLKLSEAVEGKFNLVIHLINELLEACTFSKGGYEKDLNEVRFKKETTEIREKAGKEAKEMAAKYHQELKAQIDKAQEEYKAAMDATPVGWNAVAMGMAETLSNGVSSLISGGIFRTFFNLAARKCNTADTKHDSKTTGGAVNSIIFQSDHLKHLISMLLLLLDQDGNIDMNKLMNEKNRTAITKLCKGSLERFQQEAEKGEDCKEKDNALKICQAAIEICVEVEILAMSKEADAKVSPDLAAKIKKVQQESTEFQSRCKLATGSMGVTATPPNMAKAQQKEESSGMTIASNNARFKVEQSAAQLQASQAMYERNFENMKTCNEDLEEILETMRNCKIQEIDFNKTVEMLMKGLDALGRVKEQWGKMVLFFTMMLNLIEISLGSSLNKFTQYSENALECSTYTENQMLQDMLYTQTCQATNIASLVHMISETYVQVSTQHLMGSVNSLGKLLGLDPNRDKGKFEEEHKKFGTDCKATSGAIESLVKKNKEDYKNRLQARIDSVRALLPPATPEEVKEVCDIVQGAKQAAITEMSEEDVNEYI